MTLSDGYGMDINCRAGPRERARPIQDTNDVNEDTVDVSGRGGDLMMGRGAPLTTSKAQCQFCSVRPKYLR